MTSESQRQAIRELAYAKWELAGNPDGDGVKFWLDAEQEILAQDVTPKIAVVEPPPLKLSKASTTRKRAG